MVIEVLRQKYKVGCRRCINKIEKKYLLAELNMIIEWKYCSFPKKLDESKIEKDEDGNVIQPEGGFPEDLYIEDREFLGHEPELKPGDCFLFEGQVIAVDEDDRLVLITSETGGLALQRVWEDIIEPEIDMIFNDFPINDVEWEEWTKDQIPANYEVVTPSYKYYKIWKDHFVSGRFEDNDDLCIKCEIDTDDLIMPTTVYMHKWNVRYDPNDFMDENQAKDIMTQVISWFYQYENRKVYNKPKTAEDIQLEQQLKASMNP